MRRERRTQKAFARQTGGSSSKLNSTVESFSLGSLEKPTSSIQGKKKRPQSSSSSPISVKCYFLLFIFMIMTYMLYQVPVLLSSQQNGGSSSSASAANGISSISQKIAALTKRKSLRSMPVMLPKPGEYAPMHQDTIIPLVKLWRAPTAHYHIFSISSEEDLAYTVLTNVLMGLFDEPDEHLGIVKWSSIGEQYLTRYKNEWVDNNATIVSHTLDTDLLQLQREFRTSYRNLFFVVVDRGQAECVIPQETIMICVPLADLTYQGIEDEKMVISRVLTRIQTELPYFAKVDFSIKQLEALRRLTFMYDMQLQMRDMPQTSSETKYGIKGGTAL